jgi:hypothetical protein
MNEFLHGKTSLQQQHAINQSRERKRRNNIKWERIKYPTKHNKKRMVGINFHTNLLPTNNNKPTKTKTKTKQTTFQTILKN